MCQAYHKLLDALQNNIELLAPDQIKKWASLEFVGMTRKSIQEINLSSDQERKGKSTVHKKSMPVARCICGCEILGVPDLKPMYRAIKKHVTEHKQADDGLALDSLEEFLAEQFLIVASEKICKM